MIELTAEDTDRALQSFYVRAGLEGPQVLFGWTAAESSVLEVQVRRKLQEYPRDLDDGTLVHSVVVDLGASVAGGEISGLLSEDAQSGDSAWWYYRAFVKHPPLPIDEQLGGYAHQTVPDLGEWGAPTAELVDATASVPVDLQAFSDFTVVVQNSSFAALSMQLQHAPTEDGPWIAFDGGLLAQNETAQFQYHGQAKKYFRITGHGSVFESWVFTQQEPYWAFSPLNSLPVLAYKTGRHLEVMWEGRVLPEIYLREDLKGAQQYLFQQLDGAELFNVGLNNQESGFLYRFLKILSLELDRVDAYLRALREFQSDLGNAPAQVLPHIAFELGWELDTTLPINEQRFELFRLAGFYKARGSLRLMQQISEQLLNCIPRIQEGGGLVLRFADPDLFGV